MFVAYYHFQWFFCDHHRLWNTFSEQRYQYGCAYSSSSSLSFVAFIVAIIFPGGSKRKSLQLLALDIILNVIVIIVVMIVDSYAGFKSEEESSVVVSSISTSYSALTFILRMSLTFIFRMSLLIRYIAWERHFQDVVPMISFDHWTRA